MTLKEKELRLSMMGVEIKLSKFIAEDGDGREVILNGHWYAFIPKKELDVNNPHASSEYIFMFKKSEAIETAWDAMQWELENVRRDTAKT